MCSERIVGSTGKEVRRPARGVCRDHCERVFNTLNLFIILSQLFKSIFEITVSLIYQVLLIPAVQQSDSVVHIYAFLFKNLLFHYGLSQDIEYSSLCYTIGLDCLSIPYVKAYICYAPPPTPFTWPPPRQQPVCSLCLRFCFCFLGMFICVIFVSFVSLFLFFYTVLP